MDLKSELSDYFTFKSTLLMTHFNDMIDLLFNPIDVVVALISLYNDYYY
jgi:hypothetical protein